MKTTTILLLLIIALSSCNQTPECETDNYGTFSVVNNTNCMYSVGIRRYVGVAWVVEYNLSVNPNSTQTVNVGIGDVNVSYSCSGAPNYTNYSIEQCGEHSLQIP